MFPWKLMADPDGYIFTWLIAYSALLGALAGIMICDYYVVRKTNFKLEELFKVNGKYQGHNSIAWIAFVLSILPTIPGFLVVVGAINEELIPTFLVDLYSYAWFVTFALSFIIYYIFKKK